MKKRAAIDVILESQRRRGFEPGRTIAIFNEPGPVRPITPRQSAAMKKLFSSRRGLKKL